jgi:hypothetical protein
VRATRTGVRDATTFRRTIGLGEVTVIPGSWVAVDEAASWDIALLPIPQISSQLALLTWKARPAKNAMDIS